MRRLLLAFVTTSLVLGLTAPVGAQEAPTPFQGGQVVLDGGPRALPAGDADALAAAPVVGGDGTVLASSIEEYQEETSVDPSAPRTAQPSQDHVGRQAGATRGIGPCDPQTYADNPHETRGQVSIHGWWRAGTCGGAVKATVRVCLLEWWVDSRGNRRWVSKGCTTDTIKQAGKSRKPAVNKRRTCTSFSTTGWANLVDVDVAGTWDNTEDGYKTANVGCRVYR